MQGECDASGEGVPASSQAQPGNPAGEEDFPSSVRSQLGNLALDEELPGSNRVQGDAPANSEELSQLRKGNVVAEDDIPGLSELQGVVPLNREDLPTAIHGEEVPPLEDEQRSGLSQMQGGNDANGEGMPFVIQAQGDDPAGVGSSCRDGVVMPAMGPARGVAGAGEDGAHVPAPSREAAAVPRELGGVAGGYSPPDHASEGHSAPDPAETPTRGGLAGSGVVIHDHYWRSPRYPGHEAEAPVPGDLGSETLDLYGDENNLAGFMALLQAVISNVKASGEEIHSLRAGQHVVVFLSRGGLYLVAVAATGESVPALSAQLDLMYKQVLLILTDAMEKVLSRNAKYDLRNLLGGTDGVLTSLIHACNWSASVIFRALAPLPLPCRVRWAAANALKGSHCPGLFLGLLLAGHQVVACATQVSKKSKCLGAEDVLLLINFVMASESFRLSESMSPVCLPNNNSAAFVHAYVYFLEPEVCLVLLTRQPETFHCLSNCRKSIETSLRSTGVVREVLASLQRGAPDIRIEGFPPAAATGSAAAAATTGSAVAAATTMSGPVGPASTIAGFIGSAMGSNPTGPSLEGTSSFTIPTGIAQVGSFTSFFLPKRDASSGPSDARAGDGSSSSGATGNASHPAGVGPSPASLAPSQLWHFVYLQRTSTASYPGVGVDAMQVFMPAFGGSTGPALQKRILRKYQELYVSSHHYTDAGHAHKMQVRRDAHCVVMSWVMADFEIFVAFDPRVDKVIKKA
eukprot:jgi/Mesvir1/5906/Mv00676-RA.1